MKKIDIHCHTTNRKLKGVLVESATLDAIAEKMKEHDIAKTVVVATYFPHKTSGISNFRLLHWIKDRPEFCMFGSLDFEFYFCQGINELNELAEAGLIKGIKIYTGYQNIDLHSDKLKETVSIAKKYSLPMMFHCGYSYTSRHKCNRMAITEVVKASDVEFIAEENPEVNLIIGHMSKPFLDDVISVVKKNTNIYTDVCGLIDSKYDRKEIPDCIEDIKKFLGECGPANLLFGTDFPVQTHEDSIHFVEEAMKTRPASEKQDVYYNNAMALLKIEQ